MTRHFLDLASAGPEAISAMLDEAARRKQVRKGRPKGTPDDDAPLDGRALALIFEKNSTRTRVSFDMAMRQLGGTTIVMDSGTMQLGRGETIADTARVLSRYVDAVMLRTDDHEKIVELAQHSDIPVINGLTDRSHPCQIMADMLTVAERNGKGVKGTTWAWLGDGNNVLHSIIEAGSLMGFKVRIGCPESLDPDEDVVGAAKQRGGEVSIHRSAREAVEGADIVVTDTWVSMGQDGGAAKIAALEPYRVDGGLLSASAGGSIFLHCLPAHRGEEVTSEVIDGPRSAVWDEAENRLHAQKAVLLWCFGLIG